MKRARQLDATLAALADPHRRAVIDLLRRGPQRAGDLAQTLALSAPRMSQHLKVLRGSGLVRESGDEKDARVRLYELRPERFESLREWVLEVESFWTDQLEAFRDYAERRRRSR
jgi:DNA-binding transcriptional ArsR family regulator